MADDWNNDWGEPADGGADGWIDDEVDVHGPTQAMPGILTDDPPHQPPVDLRRSQQHQSTRQVPVDALQKEIEDGKTMAILSHASLLFGLPMFMIPMFSRDNRFALHHSKAAAVTFFWFWVAAAATFVTCGLFVPLMLLCYIPALIGLIQAANGKLAGPWGMGGLGEAIFSGLKVPPERLPDDLPPQ